MDIAPCIECGQRNGYGILGGSCTRCARDNRLFSLRCIADEHEKAWSDYCDIIYRVEVFEGERVPPSDRPDPNGVQGEPATRASSRAQEARLKFSPSMKQGPGRSSLTEDDLT